MKSKAILLILAAVFLLFSDSYSQYLRNDRINLKQDLTLNSTSKSSDAKFFLGTGLGFAFVSSNSGIAVSMFSELKFDKFSFVPIANYWKVDNRSNFQMAALARYTFTMSNVNPYIDGGIGFNFYDNKEPSINESFTKIGLDIGAGMDFPGLIENAVVFVDGKYKVIISNSKKEGNIESYTLTGGIKFIL
ncbi:MAG: hypothetical protein JW917_00265 [Ignavibacteria bacterium]|nr:hypothetical protein [Ignavibacteria bacterium]